MILNEKITQRDRLAKNLLSNVYVLAKFLKTCIPVYRNLSDDEIISCIVSSTEDEKSNTVRGLNIEENSEGDSKIIYDLLYAIKSPSGRKTIILNIEMQKESMGHEVLYYRGIYYACRLISRQKNIEFMGNNYKEMNEVYSVWIFPFEKDSDITKYVMKPETLYGKPPRFHRNSMINVLNIGIGDVAPRNNEFLEVL